MRSKATLQAASVLSNFGAVAPSVISNRTSYASAMGTGETAGDIDKNADEEIKQVWEFLSKKLFEVLPKNKKKLTA